MFEGQTADPRISQANDDAPVEVGWNAAGRQPSGPDRQSGDRRGTETAPRFPAAMAFASRAGGTRRRSGRSRHGPRDRACAWHRTPRVSCRTLPAAIAGQMAEELEQIALTLDAAPDRPADAGLEELDVLLAGPVEDNLGALVNAVRWRA